MTSSTQPTRCEDCGASKADPAAACPVCGSGPGVPRAAAPPRAAPAPAPEPESLPPAAAPLPVARAAARPPSRAHAGAIVGVARDVQTRAEQMEFNSAENEQVLTLRVDRFDEEGSALGSVPVEMRGRKLRGFVSDGDWVEIREAWREGELLEPRRLRNLSTGALVEVRGRNRQWVGLLIFLVIVALMVGAFLWISSTFDSVGPPDFPDNFPEDFPEDFPEP